LFWSDECLNFGGRDVVSLTGFVPGLFIGICQIALIVSLACLACHVCYGWPPITRWAFIFVFIGLPTLILAAKVAGNSWMVSVTRLPHYCAAMAGIAALGGIFVRLERHQTIAFLPSGIIGPLAILAILTWWLRTRSEPGTD
jgi:hypothetical protein